MTNPYEDREAYSDRALEKAGMVHDSLLFRLTEIAQEHDELVKLRIIEPVADFDAHIADLGQELMNAKAQIQTVERDRGLRTYTDAEDRRASLLAAE